MRLLVARCEVRYTGRLTAVLPEAVRLLILKADGSLIQQAPRNLIVRKRLTGERIADNDRGLNP